MRAAPPVEIELDSGRRERAVLALTWAVAGGMWSSWLGSIDAWAVPPWVWPVVVGAAALAGAAIASPMRGRLGWDGTAWSWQPVAAGPRQPAPGLRAAVDLGHWLLLRDDAGRWCGLGRSGSAQRWHGLRLALHGVVATEPTA